jgi:preprotein translocase subunit YajC
MELYMAENTNAEVPVVVHGQDAPPPTGSPLGGLFPILIMFAIFYFVLIRPQSKERKAHEAMVAALKKGDKVVTKSGVHGRVDSVGETTVELEVTDKVRITIDKLSVARKNEKEA